CWPWAKGRGATGGPPGTRACAYGEGLPGWGGCPLYLCRDLCMDRRARLGGRATGNSRENPGRSILRRYSSQSQLGPAARRSALPENRRLTRAERNSKQVGAIDLNRLLLVARSDESYLRGRSSRSSPVSPIQRFNASTI